MTINNKNYWEDGRMKYLSLFSGIGGFELGIQNAYRSKERGVETHQKALAKAGAGLQPTQGQDTGSEDGWASKRPTNGSNQRPLCIGYSEIDKYAIKVYERQFKHENKGDATTIDTDTLPDFDLLVGGFPCQAFSVAGKRGGFNDTRGTLFFSIARILAEKKPRHLLLENVKGLLSHDSGKTFQTILGVLADLGYETEWQVLNSKDFGVPQNRERVFIIGHLGGECGRQVFPLREDAELPSESAGSDQGQSQAKVSTTIRPDVGQKADGTFVTVNQPPKILHNIYGGFKEGKARVFEDVSPTIRTSKGGGHLPSVLEDSKIRRLTPKECERLQGFPDDWTALGVGNEPISDTQRYKMCGNAVTVNVIEAIINNFKCLEE